MSIPSANSPRNRSVTLRPEEVQAGPRDTIPEITTILQKMRDLGLLTSPAVAAEARTSSPQPPVEDITPDIRTVIQRIKDLRLSASPAAAAEARAASPQPPAAAAPRKIRPTLNLTLLDKDLKLRGL